MAPNVGALYRAGSEISLQRALERFVARGPELQRAAAARASHVRTMDEHFADLFAHYECIVPAPVLQPMTPALSLDGLPEVAFAR